MEKEKLELIVTKIKSKAKFLAALQAPRSFKSKEPDDLKSPANLDKVQIDSKLSKTESDAKIRGWNIGLHDKGKLVSPE